MNSTVTNKGNSLLAKGLSGSPIEFTKIALGDGSLGAIDPKELSNVISPKIVSSVTNIKVEGDGVTSVSAVFNNENLEEGFYYREIGLFALDPDEGEILYSYGNAGTQAGYIAPTSSSLIEKIIKLELKMGAATNCVIQVSSEVVATVEYINQLIQVLNPLNASEYTANDILSKLLTVGGIGSGLDADLFDGLQSSEFGRMNNVSVYGSTSDPNSPTAPFILTTHANNPATGYFYIMTVAFGDMFSAVSGLNNCMQIATPYNTDTDGMWFRRRVNNTWGSWKKVFSSNNQLIQNTISVTTASWVASGNAKFPYKKTIAFTGLTANDIVEIRFDLASYEIAENAGIGLTEATAGNLVLYAEAIPTATLNGSYYVVKGA